MEVKKTSAPKATPPKPKKAAPKPTKAASKTSKMSSKSKSSKPTSKPSGMAKTAKKEMPQPVEITKKEAGTQKADSHTHHHHHHHTTGGEAKKSTKKKAELTLDEKIQKAVAPFDQMEARIKEIDAVKNKHAKFYDMMGIVSEKADADKEIEDARSDTMSNEEKIINNSKMARSKKLDAVLNPVESKVKTAYNAKTDLQKNLKDSPMIVRMVQHVGEVSGGEKMAAMLKAESRYATEVAIDESNMEKIDKHTGASEEEQKKRKEERRAKRAAEKDEKLKQYQWDELHKDPDQATQEEEAADEKSENRKGFFELVLDLITSVLGNQSDYDDTIENTGDFIKSVGQAQRGELAGSKAKVLEIGELENPGVLGYLSAGAAVFNAGYSAFKMFKDIFGMFKNKNDSDSQEKWKKGRSLIENIVGVINSVLDGLSAFIDMVPLLGNIVGMIQNGMSFGVSLMNFMDNKLHKKQTANAKEKLVSRLEAKRKKYVADKSGDDTLFALRSTKDKDIYEKRNKLMAGVAAQIGVTPQVQDSSTYKPKNWVTRNLSKADAFFHKGSGTVEDQGYSEVNERLSQSMEEARQARSSGRGGETEQQRRAYKRKMHQMEALELFNEYEVQNAIEHRQQVAGGSQKSDMAKSGVKIGASFTSLCGEIITYASGGFGAPVGGGLIAIGQITKSMIGAFETMQTVGGAANSFVEGHSQRGKNKEFKRNEMGVALCERMDALSGLMDKNPWVATPDSIPEETEDKPIKQISNDFSYIKSVRQGSDMSVSSVLHATTKRQIVSSLSAIFSQDSND